MKEAFIDPFQLRISQPAIGLANRVLRGKGRFKKTAGQQKRGHQNNMQVQGENMHSKAMRAYDCLESDISAELPARCSVPQRDEVCRLERYTRRWCIAGFITIPAVALFFWLQYFSARSSGKLLFEADRLCNCRAFVSNLASDLVWTQMIWMPCNILFLLIWVALGVKLWGGKRRRSF